MRENYELTNKSLTIHIDIHGQEYKLCAFFLSSFLFFFFFFLLVRSDPKRCRKRARERTPATPGRHLVRVVVGCAIRGKASILRFDPDGRFSPRPDSVTLRLIGRPILFSFSLYLSLFQWETIRLRAKGKFPHKFENDKSRTNDEIYWLVAR